MLTRTIPEIEYLGLLRTIETQARSIERLVRIADAQMEIITVLSEAGLDVELEAVH